MKIEIADLNVENLRHAPEWPNYPFSCKYCTYWEFPEEWQSPGDPAPATEEKKEDMLGKKSEWLRHVNQEFGNCGKVVYCDGEPAGYAQYAPPGYLPNAASYDSGPPGDDAVLLACLFIPETRFRGAGIGGRILDSIIDELRQRGIRAIETFGRRGNIESPSGPAEFFLRGGFRIQRDDPEFPLLRLEL